MVSNADIDLLEPLRSAKLSHADDQSPALTMSPRHHLWKNKVVVKYGPMWRKRCHRLWATADRNLLKLAYETEEIY